MTTGWFLLRQWLIFQVTFTAGAWVLSAFKALNLWGYAALSLVWLVWAARAWKRDAPTGERFRRDIFKLRRLRKPLPLSIAIIWVASVVGGTIWASIYSDSLAYRIPRVLHWINAEGWHWIESSDRRVNVVGLNLEFLWIPAMLLFKSDRPLFLFNAVAYLFLPGIFFSFLRAMRVRGRVAWNWMWILPGGYIFAMQAASLGGDAYSAVIALLAVTLALRARRTKDVWDVWHSILAAAFLTGIKQVTVPLGLVWLPAIWPSLRLAVARPVGTLAILLVSLVMSFLPISFMNWKYTGDWKGFSAEDLAMYVQDSPLWGVAFNLFAIPIQNLQPPILPWALKWNGLMQEFAKTTEIGSHFKSDLPLAYLLRGVAEDSATPGMAVWLIAIWMALFCRRPRGGAASQDRVLLAVKWLPFAAALVFLAKSSVGYNARYITPYYPLMLPAFLAATDWPRWGWRAKGLMRAAILANLVTMSLLAISRQRPLWPAETIAAVLRKQFPESSFPQKFQASVAMKRLRGETFPKLASLIPPGEKIVGYAAGYHPIFELPLWMPLGSRRVARFSNEDSAEEIRALGIRYALVDPTVLRRSDAPETPPGALEAWLAKYNARVIEEVAAPSNPRDGRSWTAYWVELL